MPMSVGSYASRVVATNVVAKDGTGDFTDIQEAIDDLPAGGGVVYIKEGTYSISSTINVDKNNVALKGAGKSAKITMSDNKPIIEFASGVDGILVDSLYLYGRGDQGATILDNVGIKFADNSNAMIRNCWFENCEGPAIEVAGTSPTNLIRDCVIINNYDVGIDLEGGDKNTMTGCHIDNNSGTGIGMYFGNRHNVSHNTVTNNGDYGIYVGSNVTKAIVLGNVSINNTDGNIINQGTSTVIAHNVTS